MTAGELVLHSTVWLALTAWAAAEVLGQKHPGKRPNAFDWRWLWTLGALALAVHLALAMQLRHGWSHAAAVADTARQTEAKFGLNWGGGVWFNYAMIALWMIDAAWAWASPVYRSEARGWQRAVRGYFLFMWFNGAVVFPTGPVRWFGLVACTAVVWSWWRRRT
ncbi:MAG TPA: hypothetical protein VMB21_16885 [Candidatus Limnocylindria bacterium]|jgi:hypothetical protein|nr:hypothetical protein [Candidatus Limnocylindria bacterium]